MYAYSSYSGNYGSGTIALNQAITLTKVQHMCGVFNIAGLGATNMRVTVNGMYFSGLGITNGVLSPFPATAYISNSRDFTVTNQDIIVIGGRQDTNVDMTVTFS